MCGRSKCISGAWITSGLKVRPPRVNPINIMLTIDNEASPQHWSSTGTIRNKYGTTDSAIVPGRTSARKPACPCTWKRHAAYIVSQYCNVLPQRTQENATWFYYTEKQRKKNNVRRLCISSLWKTEFYLCRLKSQELNELSLDSNPRWDCKR